MRKSLILAAAAALAMTSCGGIGLARTQESEPAFPELRQSPKRRKSKTGNKIRVFMGYASDRKGKGQKKREALLQRSIVGLAKYGVTTDNNPLTLRAWLQHALEEALDMANYLQAAITKLDKEN